MQRIEAIPCTNFKSRLKTTRKLMRKGLHVEHIGNNVLLINYSTQEKKVC